MIRPVTCICFAMAVASGLYLYQAKDAAQVLDRKIEKTVRETEATRDQTRALRTEWTLLNEPDRVRQLAQRYIPALQPVAPSQFANLSDLGSRLPAPQVDPTPDQAPLPEEGGPDGTSGSDPVIAQPGTAEDLPLPPLPPLLPQPIIQASSASAVPARPFPGQTSPSPASSGAQPQPTARDPEHGSTATKPAATIALVQPQGPRVPVPEPRPVTPRPADGQRQAETRPPSAPVAIELPRTADPSRTTDPSKPAEARGATAPRPVAPIRPIAPAGPSAPVRPTPPGGSLLGMARDGAGAPPPVPIPRPLPVIANPGQWASGGG